VSGLMPGSEKPATRKRRRLVFILVRLELCPASSPLTEVAARQVQRLVFLAVQLPAAIVAPFVVWNWT
jgi:hypothetical protein